MAGLYIHIPFCKSRCIYCGFYSTTALEQRQRYVDAVCQEMEMRRLPASVSGKRERIETVYLGGGTPSQLTPAQLQQLSLYINKVYGTGYHEFTIEVNPDDVTTEFAAMLPRQGINRVSMGAQTFDDNRLRFLHRRHTASQVSCAVRRLRNAGIQNISVDLMYGFPDETLEDWEHDIDTALALHVEHLSAYCLTIEEGTSLYDMLNKKNTINSSLFTLHSSLPSEELERQMYELLIDKLTAEGYEHYEISNFARKASPIGGGWRGLHNSNYWRDIPYIGIGAAAHSYDGKSRSWNVSDLTTYMEAVERGERPYEEETLDDDTRYNDRITVALRTSEGLDLDTLSNKYRSYCEKESQRYIDQGLLRREGSHLLLTRKGLFVSNDIMSSLIYL